MKKVSHTDINAVLIGIRRGEITFGRRDGDQGGFTCNLCEGQKSRNQKGWNEYKNAVRMYEYDGGLN